MPPKRCQETVRASSAAPQRGYKRTYRRRERRLATRPADAAVASGSTRGRLALVGRLVGLVGALGLVLCHLVGRGHLLLGRDGLEELG